MSIPIVAMRPIELAMPLALVLVSASTSACGPGDEVTALGDDMSAATQANLTELHLRADRALETMLLDYWRQHGGNLAELHPDTGRVTGYWTFALGLDAILDGVERTHGRRFFGLIETMYEAQAARGFSRPFFDDENWMALALLRAHALTHDAKYLDESRALLDDIIRFAWDESHCGAPGNFWDRAHTQKATASNAGPVITAARMAAATGDTKYLAYARRLYAAWRAAALEPGTHAILDHLDCSNDARVRWRYTYNEGLMIGAALELYRAGGEQTYLDDALAIGKAMMRDETRQGASGRVLFDGTDAHCSHDCAQFKGIGYRYLTELSRAVPADAEIRAVLDASAASLWNVARDPARDLFGVDWLSRPGASFLVEAESSAASALSVHASLVGAAPPSSLGSPNVFEAEEATLHDLGLEASHGGFTGWGYVAGWDQDGQWLDFHPTVSAAGRHRLVLRYAAASGEAARSIHVNGRAAVADQRFPKSAAWTDYRTVALEVSLAEGRNTVSIIFDRSQGSTGWLNLDHLQVE